MAKLDSISYKGTKYELAPEIAPLFSPNSAFTKGDCVIYNAVLYKFTANHSAGAWTGNDAEVIEVADRLNKISDSVAPEFDSSASYTAGQMVLKNGVLYRFTSAHTGAWTGTDAVAVTVGGEVEETKIESSFVFDEKSNDLTFAQGSINGTTGAAASNSKRIKTNYCINNDIVGIKIATGYSALVFAFSGLTYAGVWNGSELKTDGTAVWIYGTFMFKAIPGNYTFKIVLRKNSEAAIIPSEGVNVKTLYISSEITNDYAILKKLQGCFLSGKYVNSDFEKTGLLRYKNSTGKDELDSTITTCKTTLHISLEGIRYIKYRGIYGNYSPTTNSTLIGMAFYDKYHNYITHPAFDTNTQSGLIDLDDYPTAVFARFSASNDVTDCGFELYSETLDDAQNRNKVLFGAYYFAGWSEWELPNIHFTKSLLQDYDNRKPVWGWFPHGSYRCNAWLYSPEIAIGAGTTEMTWVGSCVFNSSECSINVFVDGVWSALTVNLGDYDDPDITAHTVDLSSYANKTIKLGFRIRNGNTEISPIWTINQITITTDGITIFTRNFINDGVKDFTTNDEETWKHGVATLGYSDVNGYVGCAYDVKNTEIIEKEIILAKNKGIDYFIMDWYYHDNNSSINEEAIDEEPNHIAVKAFTNAAHKYEFKYCIMISNHSPFIINGLQNWKDAIDYINDHYIKDPAYLKYNGRPVVNVFDPEYFIPIKDDLDSYIINTLGYTDGFIWQIRNENAGYNVGLPKVATGEEPVERPYSDILTPTKANIQNMFENNQDSYESYFPYLTVRWDPRPWAVRPSGYSRNTDYCDTVVSQWKEAVDWSIKWVRTYQVGFKSVLVYAWNEMGEGGYLVPTSGDKGADFLGVINKSKKELSARLA